MNRPTINAFLVARVPGFEPRSTVLETAILPLNYARLLIVVIKHQSEGGIPRSHLHLIFAIQLGDDFSNLTSTDCTATFTDSETQSFVHRDWSDQLNGDRNVVTW